MTEQQIRAAIKRLSGAWSRAHYGDDDVKASEIQCELEELECMLTETDNDQGVTPTEPVCETPPAGWYCTREKGHGGPCAALPKVNP